MSCSIVKFEDSINREIKVQYLLSELPEQKKRKKSNKEQNVSKWLDNHIIDSVICDCKDKH